MTLALVPVGATITRRYYTVPQHHTTGDEFDTWDDAVRAAQQRRQDLVASLTGTLGGWSAPEDIERTADVQVVVALRWTLRYPDGGGLDTEVQRHGNVMQLRTHAQLAGDGGQDWEVEHVRDGHEAHRRGALNPSGRDRQVLARMAQCPVCTPA
jgi:hypothetical protein